MKKVITLILALMLCLSLLPLSALAADNDFLIEDGVLVKYNGDGGDVVIPDGVKVIGDWSFIAMYDVTSVTIPSSVTEIGEGAFLGCDGLTSIVIPNSVTTLGKNAFTSCDNLTSVTIPGSVTIIGDQAFQFCDSLTSVEIQYGVTEIGENAFTGCNILKSITIPGSVISIKHSAFYGCDNLTSVEMQNGVVHIEGSVFYDCINLKNVTMPDSLTSIGTKAFYECESLTSIVIPGSVTSIGEMAFNDSEKLTIQGIAGSYAETYAKQESIKFEALDIPTPTEKPSSWAEADIAAAVETGLVPSALQSKYTQATTRAEFAALAVQLYETIMGQEITERVTFGDTKDVNVEKAAAIGVVNGVGDGKFNPNAGLTREQAATMLARLAEAVGKPIDEQTSTFADNASVSSWASTAVGQMQATGIMGGVGNNQFSPKGTYTREQSIVTVYRLYGLVK